jgi:hypothetical protein
VSELNKLIAALSGKAMPVLDPDDPLFISVQLYREAAKEGLAEATAQLGKMVTEASASLAASLAQTDTAARAYADRHVTEASRWAVEQIRAAGQDAAAEITKQMEPLVARAEVAAKRSVVFGWIAAAAALAALGSAGVVVWLS